MTTNYQNNQISFRYFHTDVAYEGDTIDDSAGAVEVFTLRLAVVGADEDMLLHIADAGLNNLSEAWDFEEEAPSIPARKFFEDYQAGDIEKLQIAMNTKTQANGDKDIDVFFCGIPYGTGQGDITPERLDYMLDDLLRRHATKYYAELDDAAA